jgi:hypothetical protein
LKFIGHFLPPVLEPVFVFAIDRIPSLTENNMTFIAIFVDNVCQADHG